MRFSISAILVAITLIATACAAVTSQSAVWTSVILSISLVLFATMIVRAIALRAEQRAFALAFAVVGGAYLLLASTTAFRVHAFLITNYTLAWAAWHADAVPEAMYSKSGGAGFFSVSGQLSPAVVALQQFGGKAARSTATWDEIVDAAISEAPYSLDLQRFFLVGHCVWSWICGLVASWFTVVLSRRACPISQKVPG